MLRWSYLGRCSLREALILQNKLFVEKEQCILFAEHAPYAYTCPEKKYTESLWRSPPTPAELLHLELTESRGGSMTYHGPGQIVCYMLLDVEQWGINSITAINNVIDSLLGRYLAEFALPAYRRMRPIAAQGIWTRGRKIASRGVRRSGTFTRFGFALNLTTDLSYFDRIYPCGIDIQMTSILEETGTHVYPFQAAPRLAYHIGDALGAEMLAYPHKLLRKS